MGQLGALLCTDRGGEEVVPGGGRGRLALYGLLGQQLLLLVGQHHRQHQGGGRQVAQAQQQVDHGLLGGGRVTELSRPKTIAVLCFLNAISGRSLVLVF